MLNFDRIHDESFDIAIQAYEGVNEDNENPQPLPDAYVRKW